MDLWCKKQRFACIECFQEAAGHGGDVVLREGSVLFQSVATTLLYCCRNHKGQEVGVVTGLVGVVMGGIAFTA